MNTNRENFLNSVKVADTKLIEEIEFRNANKEWLRKSKRIAVKVLIALKEQGMTQKDLATKMQVSPQYVNKIVKGNENLTIETISKLEDLLNVEILISPENKQSGFVSFPEYKSSYYGQSSYIQYSQHPNSYLKAI